MRLGLPAAVCLSLWVGVGARAGVATGPRPVMSTGEARMERAVEQAKGSPLRLRALLVAMPKGADLHMHLSGAVYAETLIADGRDDLLCVDPAVPAFVPNVGTTRSLPPQAVCGEGRVSSAEAFAKQGLYDRLIDGFSMRAFVPTPGWSGHDQFFATFDRFDPTHGAGARHGGEWLDEVATRAAAQNEQYLEVMQTPDLGRAIALAKRVTWATEPVETAAYGQVVTGTDAVAMERMREEMVRAPEFLEAIRADRAELSGALAERRRRERCDEAKAASAACAVDVRFLFQVLRANGPELVFAQTLLGFELAEREAEEHGAVAEVVGLNFVQPEDNRVAMEEYTRQMRMIGFLRTRYPRVHVSLHAGELVEGLVPPMGLRFHIRQAVEIAGAERIGHGVDVTDEDGAAGLLREMAERHVMTELNLTSNDVILGVRGATQPMGVYVGAGVPVALSTDDEGVSRIDLTHEYVRAVLEQGQDYVGLKRAARTSLEHSFLPGASLWAERDVFRVRVAACATDGAACEQYRGANPKAAAQWELERRLMEFEGTPVNRDVIGYK